MLLFPIKIRRSRPSAQSTELCTGSGTIYHHANFMTLITDCTLPQPAEGYKNLRIERNNEER